MINDKSKKERRKEELICWEIGWRR